MLTMCYLFNLHNQNPNYYYLVPILLKIKLRLSEVKILAPHIQLLENI